MELRLEQAAVCISGRSVFGPRDRVARPGRLLVLAGPSGSGKTTMLNALGLLQRLDSGRVTIDGADATRWRDARRRRFWQRHVAFVFQDYGLIEEDTVASNVVVGRRSVRGRATQRAAVDAALARVMLDARGGEQTARLSGGEKQRVSLARAMFRRADVVLADEPTASLDRANRELVTRFLLEEATRGATVIAATHDDDLMAAAHDLVLLQPPAADAPVQRRAEAAVAAAARPALALDAGAPRDC